MGKLLTLVICALTCVSALRIHEMPGKQSEAPASMADVSGSTTGGAGLFPICTNDGFWAVPVKVRESMGYHGLLAKVETFNLPLTTHGFLCAEDPTFQSSRNILEHAGEDVSDIEKYKLGTPWCHTCDGSDGTGGDFPTLLHAAMDLTTDEAKAYESMGLISNIDTSFQWYKKKVRFVSPMFGTPQGNPYGLGCWSWLARCDPAFTPPTGNLHTPSHFEAYVTKNWGKAVKSFQKEEQVAKEEYEEWGEDLEDQGIMMTESPFYNYSMASITNSAIMDPYNYGK